MLQRLITDIFIGLRQGLGFTFAERNDFVAQTVSFPVLPRNTLK